MSQARQLLDDLAVIGATVEPAGTQLILRAGPTAIPATLVRRVREAKSDLIAMLSGRPCEIAEQEHRFHRAVQEGHPSIEVQIVRWLDQHPNPSPAGRCAYCGQPEWTGAVVVPFGVVPGTHTWLHAECWPAWHERRRGEALRALQANPVSE
jgi:hypothetical protein